MQLSNYWQPGEFISVNLSPAQDVDTFLNDERRDHNQSLKNTLARLMPKRLAECLQLLGMVSECTLKQLDSRQQSGLSSALHQWRVQPNGTEGSRTAEVTIGGVDTSQLSPKARDVPGLYFIGEVVGVTGWLGGL